MSSASPKLGYPDLDDLSVYEGLVGYGMFDEQIPPCFTSEDLLNCEPKEPKGQPYFPIQYYASRYNHGVRTISIPHPEPYLCLCDQIRDNWKEINIHIGKPDITFSRTHVQKIGGEKRIFKMNYGARRLDEQELGYRLNCTHIVKADISNCFPSIYTHSIKWAVNGNQPRYKSTNKGNNDNWTDKLDKACRDLNSRRTIGLLIGPDTSRIISEIILTAIDHELQCDNRNGFKKVVRYIDDYTFYAEDEAEAKRFLKQLSLSLRGYELDLNIEKTKVILAEEYYDDNWRDKLNQYDFGADTQINKFDTINAYIELASELCRTEVVLSPMKYAIKVVQKKKLSDDVKRMYIKKMLGLANLHPYLLPTLESYVLPQPDDLKDLKDSVSSFSKVLIKRGLQNLSTDALAFGFYFAIKYDLDVLNDYDHDEVIKTNDCVAMALAYEYVKSKDKNLLDIFHKHADKLCQSLEAGRYWLFIYQVLISGEYSGLKNKDNYLEELNQQGVRFFKSPRLH